MILVTGASGVLGRYILAELSRRGLPFFGTSRRPPDLELARGRWKPWDLSEFKSVDELSSEFIGATAVVHAGALVPDGRSSVGAKALFDVNVRAVACLAEWALARKLPLVFISGATVYQDQFAPGISEDAAKTSGHGVELYGYSKLLGEQTLAYYRARGLRVCVLRPSSIYGFGMPAPKMIPRFLEILSKGEDLALQPPIHDRVNLVHASDVARAAALAVEATAEGEFNVPGPSAVSILEVAQACGAVVGRGRVVLPDASSDVQARTRFDLDATRISSVLGYRPAYDVVKGLEEVWSSSKSSGA